MVGIALRWLGEKEKTGGKRPEKGRERETGEESRPIGFQRTKAESSVYMPFPNSYIFPRNTRLWWLSRMTPPKRKKMTKLESPSYVNLHA